MRTKEKTALAPFEPRYTFQVWPPTATLRALGTLNALRTELSELRVRLRVLPVCG